MQFSFEFILNSQPNEDVIPALQRKAGPSSGSHLSIPNGNSNNDSKRLAIDKIELQLA